MWNGAKVHVGEAVRCDSKKALATLPCTQNRTKMFTRAASAYNPVHMSDTQAHLLDSAAFFSRTKLTQIKVFVRLWHAFT